MSRSVLLYLGLSLGGLACTGVLATACSGATGQDVLGSGSSQASSSGMASSSSGTASSSSGASGTSGSSSGSSGSSGTGACTGENEPNNQKDEANTLSPVRCGTLTKRDDKEFLTFRLQPSTKTMSINFTGRVRLKVDVADKDTTELTPDNAGIVPFVMDADYIVEVTPLTESNADINWRVELVEN